MLIALLAMLRRLALVHKLATVQLATATQVHLCLPPRQRPVMMAIYVRLAMPAMVREIVQVRLI